MRTIILYFLLSFHCLLIGNGLQLEPTKKELQEMEFSENLVTNSTNKNVKPPAIPKFLIYFIACIILILLVYFILKNTVFQRNSDTRAKEIIDLETVPESEVLLQLNLKKLLTTEKDPRKRIRVLFLLCLQQLVKVKLIDTQPSKTNNDYKTSLKGKIFFVHFELLVDLYEYAWFSQFEIDHIKASEAESLNQKIADAL